MLQNIETYFTTVVILVHLAQLCLHLRSKTKDQSFNNFEKISYKKLSVNQAKHFDLFVCQELCFYSTGVDLKFFVGLKSFQAFQDTGPRPGNSLKSPIVTCIQRLFTCNVRSQNHSDHFHDGDRLFNFQQQDRNRNSRQLAGLETTIQYTNILVQNIVNV